MHFRTIVALFTLAAPAFAFPQAQSFYTRDLSTTNAGTITARDLAFALLDELEARAHSDLDLEARTGGTATKAKNPKTLAEIEKKLAPLRDNIKDYERRIAAMEKGTTQAALKKDASYTDLKANLAKLYTQRTQLTSQHVG